MASRPAERSDCRGGEQGPPPKSSCFSVLSFYMYFFPLCYQAWIEIREREKNTGERDQRGVLETAARRMPRDRASHSGLEGPVVVSGREDFFPAVEKQFSRKKSGLPVLVSMASCLGELRSGTVMTRCRRGSAGAFLRSQALRRPEDVVPAGFGTWGCEQRPSVVRVRVNDSRGFEDCARRSPANAGDAFAETPCWCWAHTGDVSWGPVGILDTSSECPLDYCLCVRHFGPAGKTFPWNCHALALCP